jgi:hypothetical protein
MPDLKWIILILVAVAVIAIVRDYLRRKRLANSASLASDPNDFMPQMANEAVQYATGHGKTLDFTPDSVKVVESLLGELHESRAKRELSDRDLNIRALQFGAYIGEVIRRKYNGSWGSDHPVAGPKSFPIRFNEHDSFPVGWCGKRMLNGDEDNIWIKFKMVTSDEFLRGDMTRPNPSNDPQAGESSS